MYHIVARLTPEGTGRKPQAVTPRGLHGLLFKVLADCDSAKATWLHEHPEPKPFSLWAEKDNHGRVQTLHYKTITEESADALTKAWQNAYEKNTPLQLGLNSYHIAQLSVLPYPDFAQLASQPLPSHPQQQTLHFLSPTDFKQGPVYLPLPLPRNVFGSPLRLWNSFAPQPLHIDNEWLNWCEQNVYVKQHNIHTVTLPLNDRSSLTGFVGTVTFRAHKGDDQQLQIWHTLGTFATFCGIGRKTTMGMGAVDKA
jgi:CRISPR-associated endoribonuclease Cas6